LGWTVERSAEVVSDLAAIFDHLLASRLAFGEPPHRAYAGCRERIDRIEDEIDRLALAPFQGVRDDAVSPGLRHVTKDQAIIYFEPIEALRVIRVLAVFFGGQDHTRRMLARMLR
jgi:plasmid stabilization system protein ParE